MSTQNVDFAQTGATADTGEEDSAAIRPIVNGEPAIESVLSRPDENLRVRTEVVRDELEALKYLTDADRAILAYGGGNILWNGVALGGGDGAFSMTQDLTIRPFLAVATSTKARAVIRGVSFETQLAGAVVPRAYSGANKISVRLEGSNGATLGVAIDGTPADNVTITVDTHPSTGTTKQQLIDYLTLNGSAGPVAYRALGLTAALDTGAVGTDKVNDTGVWTYTGGTPDEKLLAGAVDAEKHVLTAAGLAAFFGDSANAMVEGDVLAIWYDELVNGSFGGRRESLGDLPENSANVDNNIFLLRRFPERMPLALPIATVVSDSLRFIDGSVIPKGLALPLSGGGQGLPTPTTEPPPKFLGMDPAGAHSWESVDDVDLVGGLMSVADTTARDAIPSAQRKEGMVVYSQLDDRHFVLEGGTANGNWKEFGDDNRLVGGLQTVADTTARNAIPAAKLKEGMIVYCQDIDRHFVREGGTWVDVLDNRRLIGGVHTVAANQVNSTDATLNALVPAAQRTNNMLVAVRVPIGLGDLHRVMRYDGSDTWRPAEGAVLERIRHRAPPSILCDTQVAGSSGAWTVALEISLDNVNVVMANGEIADEGGVYPNAVIEGQVGNTLPARIESGVPVIDGTTPVVIYLFVRKKHGESTWTLRYSSSAPASDGMCTVAEVGYTTADYAYVGMAWILNAYVADATVGTIPKRVRQRHIYGSSEVVNTGQGRAFERIISNPRADGLGAVHTITWDTVNPDTTTYGFSAGLTSALAAFVTAARVRVLVSVTFKNTDGATAVVRARMGSDGVRASLPPSTTQAHSFVTDLSINSGSRDHEIVYEVLTSNTPGTMELSDTTCTIIGVAEDINHFYRSLGEV